MKVSKSTIILITIVLVIVSTVVSIFVFAPKSFVGTDYAKYEQTMIKNGQMATNNSIYFK